MPGPPYRLRDVSLKTVSLRSTPPMSTLAMSQSTLCLTSIVSTGPSLLRCRWWHGFSETHPAQPWRAFISSLRQARSYIQEITKRHQALAEAERGSMCNSRPERRGLGQSPVKACRGVWGSAPVYSVAAKQKPPGVIDARGFEVWRQPTLPLGVAVPSARMSLTSLFGMGRGGSSPL